MIKVSKNEILLIFRILLLKKKQILIKDEGRGSFS